MLLCVGSPPGIHNAQMKSTNKKSDKNAIGRFPSELLKDIKNKSVGRPVKADGAKKPVSHTDSKSTTKGSDTSQIPASKKPTVIYKKSLNMVLSKSSL